jgi:hypothetical protein
MHIQTPQPGVTRSELSRTTGVSADTSHNGTQQERRLQLGHCDAAHAATKHMTQSAHFIIVRKTGSSKNLKQYGIGCAYMYTVVNSRQIPG